MIINVKREKKEKKNFTSYNKIEIWLCITHPPYSINKVAGGQKVNKKYTFLNLV